MNAYPTVRNESDTINRVKCGGSIGRFGDGELKLLMGRDCVSQKACPKLQHELQALLAAKETVAMMGIPNLDPRGPKLANWTKIAPKFIPFLHPGRQYASAFITRPDSAPWINRPEFFDSIQDLWKGKAVTFVGNNVRSLKKEFLLETGATKVFWVPCPYRDAYVSINRIQREVLEAPTDIVIMCAGATATCLAERLAREGKHAIDLGHIGMFWRRFDENYNWKEQREINAETGKVEENP